MKHYVNRPFSSAVEKLVGVPRCSVAPISRESHGISDTKEKMANRIQTH